MLVRHHIQNATHSKHTHQNKKRHQLQFCSRKLSSKHRIQCKLHTCNSYKRIIVLGFNLVTVRRNQPLLHSLTQRASHVDHSNRHIQFLTILSTLHYWNSTTFDETQMKETKKTTFLVFPKTPTSRFVKRVKVVCLHSCLVWFLSGL